MTTLETLPPFFFTDVVRVVRENKNTQADAAARDLLNVVVDADRDDVARLSAAITEAAAAGVSFESAPWLLG
jgi:hypothetical protein